MSHSDVVNGCFVQKEKVLLEIPNIPDDYREYLDVFSIQKAKSLPDHRPYDLAIQIEGDKMPLLGPIYSLLTLELKTLQEFLEKNLWIGTIYSSKSSCGAPVLFVKKKDGTLYLCVDYQDLNQLTYKDCYPISLLNNLLDTSRKAWVYSKIDLKNVYHLVHIAKGNEWKIAFCTRYGFFEWLVMLFGLSNTSAVF